MAYPTPKESRAIPRLSRTIPVNRLRKGTAWATEEKKLKATIIRTRR